jgi:excisionase family DNA binding protein
VLVRSIDIHTVVAAMENHTSKQRRRGLYTAAEIAEMLSVEPRTIHCWAEAGKIPVALRASRTVRFDLDDVKAALAKETAEAQRIKLERRQVTQRASSNPVSENTQTPRNSHS